MIKRFYDLESYLKPNKVVLIYWSRRSGKTTLLNNFLGKCKLKYKLDSGDNISTQNILWSQDFKLILEYAEGYDLIAIDEAQNIPNIWMWLKILVDQIPGIKVIATRSSSFDLSQQIWEPLTWRKITLNLFPISQIELLNKYNKFELKEKLEEYMIFGSYPEVIQWKTNNDKRWILNEIVDSYLLKDILSLERVKWSKIIMDLLKLLSFQVWSLVSLNELSKNLKIDIKTVWRYLDLLEKSFIIINIWWFSRNLRKEIVKKWKYIFLDNWIRNAVISQFNWLNMRNDIGAIWENFIFSERIKKCSIDDVYQKHYFWRTYDGQEVDIVEEKNWIIYWYEIKWSEKKNVKPPKDWKPTYTNSDFQVVNRENYMDFIL